MRTIIYNYLQIVIYSKIHIFIDSYVHRFIYSYIHDVIVCVCVYIARNCTLPFIILDQAIQVLWLTWMCIPHGPHVALMVINDHKCGSFAITMEHHGTLIP